MPNPVFCLVLGQTKPSDWRDDMCLGQSALAPVEVGLALPGWPLASNRQPLISGDPTSSGREK